MYTEERFSQLEGMIDPGLIPPVVLPSPTTVVGGSVVVQTHKLI